MGFQSPLHRGPKVYSAPEEEYAKFFQSPLHRGLLELPWFLSNPSVAFQSPLHRGHSIITPLELDDERSFQSPLHRGLQYKNLELLPKIFFQSPLHRGPLQQSKGWRDNCRLSIPFTSGPKFFTTTNPAIW